jgi:F-type H+-transporting ATPase subunit epsilon
MAESEHKRVTLIIVTPYKIFFEEKVDSVVIPSLSGEIGIMAGHSPLVVALSPGICSIRTDSDVRHCVLSEGYAEIGQYLCLVICNAAEWPEDLDVSQALESYQHAKLSLQKHHEVNRDKYDIEVALQRAKARLHTIELYGSSAQRDSLSDDREMYGY